MALAQSAPLDGPAALLAIPSTLPGRATVWLRGEQDLSTATAVAEDMARAIAAGDGAVVVDLSRVTFMDASTVSTIVRAREFLRQHDRSLTLRAPSTCAGRIIALCDLTQLVDARPG